MICIIDCGTSWLKELKDAVDSGGQESFTVRLEESAATDFSGCTGAVLSGSPLNLSELDRKKYTGFLNPVLTAGIPVLAICFGHQLLGAAFGAAVSTGGKISGYRDISILKKSGLFSGMGNSAAFMEEHSEYISLPEDFELTAVSDAGMIEGIRHRELPLYGTQFHPEVSGENGKAVFSNFFRICGASSRLKQLSTSV